MGINSALNTALSGLSTNQSQIDVVGNNIANVNTVGFKSSRLDFKTQFLENFSYGTAPSGTQGGTNPLQIGLGTATGSIKRDFSSGTPQSTGVATNLAIQGDGFFIVKDGTQQVYTRDGSFQLNGLNQLVSSTGQLVQGYGVDANFNIVSSTLTNLTIPLNTLTVAQATTNAKLSGQLNSGGNAATQVSSLTLGTTATPQAFYLSTGPATVDPVNPPTGTTPLTSLTDSSGTTNYFQAGDVISLTGKIGIAGTTNGTTTSNTTISTIAPQTLTVTPTTTLGDLQSFMTGGLGINTTPGANGSIATVPGVTAPATGNSALLTINGNPGTENDLSLDNNSLTINRGGTILTPFNFNGTQADGESISTTFTAYDSLGTALNVGVTAVLQSKSNTGTTWAIFATSPSGSATGANTQTAVGIGSLSFDPNGALISSTDPTLSIDRSNTGAQPTVNIDLNFAGTQALSAKASQFGNAAPDGSPPGTLISYNIGDDGIIAGTFTNGLSRNLGQVALATFRNDQGLVDQGGNTFTEGPNSGAAIITTPDQGSAGSITSGALELSNVDLSSQFVQLISASTGFSAASRVITTSNDMLQELLSASRS